jgi:crossover junction endodeoxyribonuclease RuvC
LAKSKKQSLLQTSPSLLPINRVLGLDLSLVATGWCTLTKVPTLNSAVLSFGLLNPDGLDGARRMDWILEGIKEKTKDAFVIIEDFSFGSKGSGLSEIHGLGWLVRWYLWKTGIPFRLVPPTVLKKFATGKGNSDKNIVLKEVFKQWGPEADFNDDNISDAFVLAKIGYAMEYPEEDLKLKSHQKEIIEKLCQPSKI